MANAHVTQAMVTQHQSALSVTESQVSDLQSYVLPNTSPTFTNTTLTGYLAGPASFVIDPAGVGDNTGTVVIAGNLQVDGTQTTINSTTVSIDDLKLSVATDAADSAAANGAGITVGGANANITYTHATTSWDFDKPVNVTGAITATGISQFSDVNIPDNNAIRFGNSQDLQIYHDGFNNYIDGQTGSIIIQNTLDDYNVIIKSDNGSGGMADYFRANGSTGAALMYHYGSEKLTTTSTGINVTGDIVSNSSLQIFRQSAGAASVLLERNGAAGPWSLAQGNTSTDYFEILEGSASRLTIKNGGNVGVGNTSPNAFLSVRKDNSNSGNQFVVADTEGATAAVRTYTHNNDDSGLILNHYYAVAGGGNEYMRYADFVANVGNGAGTTMRFITKNAANTFSVGLAQDNNGNVGIGTTSPVGRLHIKASDSGYTGGIQIEDNNSATKSAITHVNGGLYISSNATNDHISILANGNVGIGTSSPATTLDVRGIITMDTKSDATNPRLVFDNDNFTGTSFIEVDRGDNAMEFWNQGSERMRITSTGSVGIGRTPPTDTHATWSQLFLGEKGSYISEKSSSGGIYGNFVTDNIYIDADTGSFANITTDESSAYRQEGGVHQWYSQASGSAGAAVTLSEKMRIDSSGKVGIGTSSPSEHLEIANNISATPSALSLFSNDTSISGTQEIGVIYGKGKDSGSSARYTGAKISYAADGTWDTGTNYYYPTAIKFYTQDASGTDTIAAGPRVIIDSSGNLLVGQSSTTIPGAGNTTAGTSIRGEDGVFISRTTSDTSASALQVNKTTGEGAIINIASGGTTVGSIGSVTQSGATNLVLDSTSAVYFDTNVRPKTDNTYDVGSSSYRFKDLHLSGNINVGGSSVVDSNRRILAADGAENVPYITFAADTNTGLYRPGANTLGFSTAGSERMRIDSSGKVGIGNNLPSSMYSTTNNLVIGDSGNSGITIKSTGGIGAISFADGVNGSERYRGQIAYSHSGDSLRFNTAAGERMRISSTGNVGIGTTSPATKLDVAGTVTADQYNNDAALPTIRPSLLLDFANSKTLDSRITFTRNSIATYYDGRSNVKAEENLFNYSQDTSQSVWGKGNVTTTIGATAPDGTSTATTLTESSGALNFSRVNNGSVTSVSSGEVYSFSMHLKANGRNFVHVRASYGSSVQNHAGFCVNLSTGAITTGYTDGTYVLPTPASSFATNLGNGWYRVGMSFTTVSGTIGLWAYQSASATTTTYTGNGTSGVLLWGYQLEKRYKTATYIETTSAPVAKYQPLLRTASPGQARFDHNPITGESKGLLIEEARTNRQFPSILDGTWSNSTTMHHQNYGIAPDGSHTAGLIYESISARQQLVSKNSGNLVSGSTYIWSVFVKPQTWDGTVQIHAYGDASTDFNIGGNDFEDSTKGMYSVGNGWKRIWWQKTKTNTNGSFYLGFSGSTYAGQGYAKAFLAWGFQLELSSFPTSYIPTTTSTTNRVVDIAEMNDISWYNNSGGTIFGQYTPANTSSWRTVFRVGASSDTNTVLLRVNSSNAKEVQAYAFGSKVVDIEASSSDYTIGAELKAATAFQNNDFVTTWDGEQIGTDTSANVPYGVTEANIGSTTGGGNNINGTIKKIAYWPERLSNDTLIEMTEE